MNNTSFVTGLALALSLGVAGIGGAQDTRPANQERAARQDSTARRGPARGRGDKMLLRGITLSANQKVALKALHEKQRKEFDAKRDTNKRGARPGGAQRQPRDTAAMQVRRAAMEQHREQRFAALRSMLTPQQRVQFDRNIAELKAGRPQRPDRG